MHHRYKSSKANQPSQPSAKTREALARRIIRGYSPDNIPQGVLQYAQVAYYGLLTKAQVYGYHPTRKAGGSRA